MKKSVLLTIDLIMAVLLIFLDQITKIWAVNRLKDGEPIILINGVLKLYYLTNGNTGAAFGILSGHRSFFLIIAIVVVTVIAFALTRIPNTKKFKLLRILLVFVAAGGVGNMIDRFRLSYVIDFIYFYLINFPIFNVADCYITVSMIVLACLFIFYYKEEDFDNIWQKKS